MRKIFTLTICLMASMASFSQTTANSFAFQDAEGNIVADGAVLTRTETTADPFGFQYIISGLYVKNVSSGRADLKIECDITQLPSGTTHSICYPGDCVDKDKIGTYESVAVDGNVAGTVSDMKAEWKHNGKYGTCTVKYTIKEYKYDGDVVNEDGIVIPTYTFIGNGPSVTVNYVNADPAGINATTAATAVTSIVYYDLQGRITTNPGKGLYIKKVKTADGNTKTVKTVLR